MGTWILKLAQNLVTNSSVCLFVSVEITTILNVHDEKISTFNDHIIVTTLLIVVPTYNCILVFVFSCDWFASNPQLGW
jgi:hypothetical protein